MSSKVPRSISAVIPIYNEEQALIDAFPVILKFLSDSFEEFEVIFVESGSRDGSRQVIERFCEASPGFVRAIFEGERRGFGSAVRAGFTAAKCETVYLQPIDVCFPLTALLEAARNLKDNASVLSFRTHDPRGWYRRLQSIVFNLICRLLFRIQLKHVNSALKLHRTTFIRSLPLQENGWLVDLEVVYYVVQSRARFTEIGAPYIERLSGVSSIRFATCVFIMRDILRFWLRVNLANSDKKLESVVSLLGLRRH